MRPKFQGETMPIIILTVEHSIATLTINRPEVKNAINAECIALLSQYLTQIAADPTIRVVILQGQGESFSAGADLNWMRSSIHCSASENRADALKLATMLQQLYALPKPTIACVHGSVFGGAIGLITCCDIAIASDSAKFCLPEVKVGLSPAMISPYVIQAIGKRASSMLMLTGEVISANRALEVNLVHQVVSDAKLESTVHNIAKNILKNSPQALKVTKQLIQHKDLKELDAHYTAGIIADLRASAEGQEGLTAFLEKRKPNWDSIT